MVCATSRAGLHDSRYSSAAQLARGGATANPNDRQHRDRHTGMVAGAVGPEDRSGILVYRRRDLRRVANSIVAPDRTPVAGNRKSGRSWFGRWVD
jgi:hypothetical protein